MWQVDERIDQNIVKHKHNTVYTTNKRNIERYRVIQYVCIIMYNTIIVRDGEGVRKLSIDSTLN